MVAHILLEQPNETPATVPTRRPESRRLFATTALARWCHVSTLWQRCGGATRTVRQRPATLQLCALRCALGSAVCHVHGLDQCDLRREQVASPRMVARDWFVAVEAERHRNCHSR